MKKKFVTIFSVFTLVIVLAITLTSCLKVGMQKNNIKKRLDEAGVSYTYERTTPITKDGERDYPFEDLMHCTKTYTTTVDGVETEVVQELYIILQAVTRLQSGRRRKRTLTLRTTRLINGTHISMTE